jgi:hypothetical protein
MIKLDLKKELKPYYMPSAKKVVLIDVPRFQFIMIDGGIEPGKEPGNSPRYQEDIAALYGAAYTLKFMVKKRAVDSIDYPVMASEGLWDVRDGVWDINIKDNWDYTMMINTPDIVTQELFEEALAQLRKKRGDQPAIARLRLDTFEEGLCVQTMHIGPYASEPVTVDRMRAFMEEQGYRDLVGRGGKHHEIYIGDPRRSAPEKLKTVLRHPVAKK